MAMAVVSVVKKNWEHITENTVTQMLRGLRIQSSWNYSFTDDCCKFNMVSNEYVKDIIHSLIRKNILIEKSERGEYGTYYILRPSKEADVFLEYCQKSENTLKQKFEQMTEIGVVRALKNGEACRKSEDIIGENLIYISNHPAIFCLVSEEVQEYAKLMSYKYRKGMELMAEFENVPSMKKYKKMLAKIKPE